MIFNSEFIRQEFINKLLLKGFLIGSRGLGVNEENSDYDIAISIEDLPKNILDNCDLSRLEHYFTIIPLGNCGLIKLERIDIIIYGDPKDLKAVKKALEYVKKYPKKCLLEKSFRIKAFEMALLYTRRFTQISLEYDNELKI